MFCDKESIKIYLFFNLYNIKPRSILSVYIYIYIYYENLFLCYDRKISMEPNFVVFFFFFSHSSR